MPRRLLLTACLLLSTASFAGAAELVRLNAKNFDEYAPQGKEADAIYGDYVLRNNKIVCVIADPIATRNANMTVRNVGGCVIDLTTRTRQNDQLSCYYPGAARLQYRFGVVGTSDGKSKGTTTNERDAQLKAHHVHLILQGARKEGEPRVILSYILEDGWDYIKVKTTYSASKKGGPTEIEVVDSFRADRTFQRFGGGASGQYGFSDDYFRQAYGVAAKGRRIVTGNAGRAGTLLRFQTGDERIVKLTPPNTHVFVRQLFPGGSLFEVKSMFNQLDETKQTTVSVCVEDNEGETISDVEVTAYAGKGLKQRYGHGYTPSDGTIKFQVPPGKYRIEVAKVGRERKRIDIDTEKSKEYTVTLVDPGYVAGNITSAAGGPIPCKVQFIGIEPTVDPDFGPDSGHTAVKNLVYTHNGKFTREIQPGKYRVVLSYGPEYDAVFKEIEVARGKKTMLEAKLTRTVDTSGWVSADFHNHSSPSGDNTSSQFGRVQNILCEHIEFAPCTEHNRVDTYAPHLKRLGVEHLMATCSGIELTGTPLPLNHQNAFPLVFKPHLQDGGGPVTDDDPEAQIARLALWDGKSEKLVQQNHPDIGWLFNDKDGDGKPDGGFKKSIPFIDAMEIHPLDSLLKPPVFERGGRVENNRIFNWLQMLNQGHRITGVVNTDSHYNFHESGFWRNYIKSGTDDPAKIETLDMVHASERGNVTMTTAPFMEVKLTTDGGGDKSQGTAGDDVVATSGKAKLHMRVQCANWYDVDRVQVYFNGRPQKELNFSRFASPKRFGRGVVKFEQTLPLEFKGDTHVIVMAVGEKSKLGVVQGPRWGDIMPIAVSNPIYVDVDGGGFKANKDTLGAPLPVKGGRPAGK